jgi:hypothetical protein
MAYLHSLMSCSIIYILLHKSIEVNGARLHKPAKEFQRGLAFIFCREVDNIYQYTLVLEHMSCMYVPVCLNLLSCIDCMVKKWVGTSFIMYYTNKRTAYLMSIGEGV